MLAYAILFLLTTFLFVMWTLSKEKKYQFVFDLLFGLVIFIFVGMRYRVGGDWDNYNDIFRYFISNELTSNLEPTFRFILQIATYNSHAHTQLIINMYYISLFLIFFYWFNYRYLGKNFSVVQMAWLLFPIFIFLQTTGYIRQAVACLFIIPILFYSFHKKYFKSIFFVLASALFHKSALIFGLIPLVHLLKIECSTLRIGFNSKKLNYIIVGSLLTLGTFSLVFFANKWIVSYINGQLASKGLVFRIIYFLILLSPIIWFSRLDIVRLVKKNWFLCISAAVFLLTFCYYFSTLVDRYLLYFYLPTAAYVISILSPDNRANKQLISLYGIMLVVNVVYSIFWLKYSYYGSTKWIPFCHMWLGCYQ